MKERPSESAVHRLRKQAERALAAAQSRRVVEPLLERLVSIAPDGSDASVFAHRHLAEYRIEDHPWRALLHLRKVAVIHGDDDVIHALMGLSHALLANFRAAVSSYRRAIGLSPRNPWYHHNLGHLLDFALDEPAQAVSHLELAYRSAPEAEIGASLAHCLARLGRLEEAKVLIDAAVAAEPRNRDHKHLLAWIECGAPADGGDICTQLGENRPVRKKSRRERVSRNEDSKRSANSAPRARGSKTKAAGDAEAAKPKARSTASDRRRTEGSRGPSPDSVSDLVARSMAGGGFTPEHIARARRLWEDYSDRSERVTRAAKPDVSAAAIEFAIASLHGLTGVTRASVARRYGVSARAVADRFDDIRAVLALKPEDPRYARC